jgi:hypothetical protein
VGTTFIKPLFTKTLIFLLYYLLALLVVGIIQLPGHSPCDRTEMVNDRPSRLSPSRLPTVTAPFLPHLFLMKEKWVS